MRALPLPESPQLLLSFDFDGTLHEPLSHQPVPPQFFDAMIWMREKHHAVWGINTGRSKEHLIEGMVEAKFPFLPDWFVVREREIFYPNNFGRLLPHKSWNDECEKKMKKLFKKAAKDLMLLKKQIAELTSAQWIDAQEEPAGLIASHVDEMEIILPLVEALGKKQPDLGWQRNDIYLRFGHKDFHKGSSMLKVAQGYNLTTEQIFAAGDGHNDMDMLSPNLAKYRACPSNAVDDVKNLLLNTDGIVSTLPYCRGVAQALEAFFLHE